MFINFVLLFSTEKIHFIYNNNDVVVKKKLKY